MIVTERSGHAAGDGRRHDCRRGDIEIVNGFLWRREAVQLVKRVQHSSVKRTSTTERLDRIPPLRQRICCYAAPMLFCDLRCAQSSVTGTTVVPSCYHEARAELSPGA